MRNIVQNFINGAGFRILIAVILSLALIQTAIIADNISNQSNPAGKYRNYGLIYDENYQIIKALLKNGSSTTNRINFNLYYSKSTAFNSNSAWCCTQVYNKNIPELYKKIMNQYAFEYCLSFKLGKNYWLNYVVIPKVGVNRVIVFLSSITLIMIILIIIFCWFFIRVLLPIKIFQDNAYLLGMKLIKKDIKPTGIKMLHDVSDSSNFMINKLFKALNLRTKMLCMITHDLKLPVSRLKLRAELGIIDEEKNIQDLMLLEQLSGQILLNIKESLFENEILKVFDLGKLIENVANKYSNVTIIKKSNDLLINAREISIIRAFDNLISNAKKYSDNVLITLTSSSNEVSIKIQDFGPGIKKSELGNIFKPFYQPEGSKIGNGLGLTITQEIIINHNGTIEITNHNQPHGVIVHVTLPR